MNRTMALRLAAAAMASAALCGCADKTASPSIVGLNCTDQYISAFVVIGYYAANLSAHGGGGKYICCTSVPLPWRPGLTAKVQWSADERDPTKWREAVVPVPRYERSGTSYFAVHFYQDGAVKVLVTSMGPNHANYPLPEPPR